MPGSKATAKRTRSFGTTFTVPVGKPTKPPQTLRGLKESNDKQKIQVLQKNSQKSDTVTNIVSSGVSGGENGCDAPRRNRIRPAPPPLKPEPNIIRPKTKFKPRPQSPEGKVKFLILNMMKTLFRRPAIRK